MLPSLKHPVKRVKYKNMEADIDVDIADLILNLWKLQIRTVNSCQDNVPRGFVWIEFAYASGAERFLTFVAEYSEDPYSVYRRMYGDTTAPKGWRYRPHLEDFGVDIAVINDTVSETFEGSHGFNFSMSVRFPRSDLKYVKERISESLRRR